MIEEKKKINVNSREKARFVAVIVVYNQKIDNNKKLHISNMIKERLLEENYIENEEEFIYDQDLFISITEGIDNKLTVINNIITNNITNKIFSFHDLDLLLLSILQCGTFELMEKKLDKKIVISQYLKIGGYFFYQKEVPIINGVLDEIAKTI